MPKRILISSYESCRVGIVASVLLCVLSCLATANAQDALWKTYMEAAEKAQANNNYNEAEKLYKLADAKAKVFGETDERYVKTLAQLITLYLIQKKKPEADSPYKQLLLSLEKGAGADSLNNANELYQLGQAFSKEKMHKEAEPLYKYALEIYKRGMRPRDKKLIDYLHFLGSNYFSQGKLKEAEATLREELEILERDPDLSKDMRIAYTLGTLGLITNSAKRYAEAESYTRRALDVVKNLHGENHPNYASMLHALFMTLLNQEKYAEAEGAMKRAIEIDENIYGKMSKEVKSVLDSLATQYLRQARYDEAASLLSRNLDILENISSPQAGDITNVADRLLGIYIKKRNYDDGEAVCKRTRAILAKNSQTNAETDLFVTNCLSRVYFLAGDYLAEADTLRKFIESQERLGTEGEVVLADMLQSLAHTSIRLKKYDDALTALRRAEKIYSKNPAKPSITLLYTFARYYYFTGQYAESESSFTKLLTLTEQRKAEVDPLSLAWFKTGYALLLYAQGKAAQAEGIFKASITTLLTDKINGERDVATRYHELATLFNSQGKHAEAEPLFKQAIELREKALSAEHPELAASLEGYALLLKKTGRVAEAVSLENRAQAIRAKRAPR